MPVISPFRGWRYNPDLIPDFSSVIVPPYDVITPNEQDQYYQKSPYNFIRINLNRSEGDKKYQDAGNILKQWKHSKVLIREDDDVLYILSQSFNQHGQQADRVGIIAALELTELGDQVLPHEQTIEKHVDDRYRLMEATQSNIGQIFMCYQDPSLVLEHYYKSLKQTPVIDCFLEEVRFRLWAINDPVFISSIKNCLLDKRVVIADGHHRYKTALKFYKNQLGIPGTNRVMVTLINSNNPWMKVLPTHRLLSNVFVDLNEAKAKLSTDFQVQTISGLKTFLKVLDLTGKEKGKMGIYFRVNKTGLLLNFHNWDKMKMKFSDRSRASQQLETNIMHSLVMKDIFNIDTNLQSDLQKITYLRGNQPVEIMLKENQDYDVACFIPPPALDDIFSIASAGENMPQKSTFFFPKVYSGLVTRCFNE